jgi:pimeloyl-ACP methyl ester carboxylesterase
MSQRSRQRPPAIKTLEVDSYEMAYLENGQGLPLVLVHGSLNDYRSWTFQMAAFGAHYRTIAVSLRQCYPEKGNGPVENFSLHRHADDLAVFVNALGSGPVHLAAHSRGGDVALIMASKHPELIRSLVLADPAPLDTMLPPLPEVRAEVEKRRTVVRTAIACLQKGDLDIGLETFIDAVSAPGNWQKLSGSVKQARRDNAWSLTSLLGDAQVPFTCADAQKIDAPVLLMTGDKSHCLYGMMHDALAPCLMHRQKVVIPNASHGMHTDNPEAFNAAVLAFLANCHVRRDE